MDLRITQIEDDTPWLVRYAPVVFLVIATLAAGLAWGWWGGLFSFCLCSLMIYKEI